MQTIILKREKDKNKKSNMHQLLGCWNSDMLTWANERFPLCLSRDKNTHTPTLHLTVTVSFSFFFFSLYRHQNFPRGGVRDCGNLCGLNTKEDNLNPDVLKKWPSESWRKRYYILWYTFFGGQVNRIYLFGGYKKMV